MALAISDAVIWHETDGSVSLYHIESAKFHTLNETASKIWALVSSQGERETVLSKLIEEFAGDSATLAIAIVADTKTFLASAIAQGWIEEHPA